MGGGSTIFLMYALCACFVLFVTGLAFALAGADRVRKGRRRRAREQAAAAPRGPLDPGKPAP